MQDFSRLVAACRDASELFDGSSLSSVSSEGHG